MKISFKKAMKVPFSGDQWQKKLGIAILLYIPFLVTSLAFGVKNPLASLLLLLASILIGGYAISSGHNEIKNIQPILPEWNFKEASLNGLKSLVINFAYLFMLSPVAIIFSVIAASQKPFIPVIVLLAIPLLVVFSFFTTMAITLFYENLKLAEAFNFKRIVKMLKVGFVDYLIAFLYTILASILFGFTGGIIAKILSVLNFMELSIFVKNITQIFAALASVNLLAQAFKVVDEKIKAQDIANEPIL